MDKEEKTEKNQLENVEKNIGIDFGTTNTVIYTRDPKGKLKKIGGKSIKSAIYFKTRDDYIIGEDAIKLAYGNEKGSKALVTNFKPNIMEKYEIVAENGEEFKLKGEAVSKLFLSKVFSDYVELRMKKMFGEVEMTLSDKTVITVPAKFNSTQKEKIKTSALNSYFPNVKIAFEPTAAAIAALDSDLDDNIIAVYDFGGGTFDVSVIEKDGNNHYTSIAEDGDKELGGNTITTHIAEELILPLLEEQGIEMYMDIDEMDFDDEEKSEMTESEYIYNIRAITENIETMKEYFTEYDSNYNESIYIMQNGNRNEVKINISKEDFDNAIEELIQKTVDITRSVIDKVSNDNKYVKKIIMAGGSSQLSLAEDMLKDEFENEGIEVILSDSVFDLIAKGALLMAEQQKIIHIEEKTDTQFGVGIRTGIGIKKFDMLIDADISLPVSGSKRFSIDNHILKLGELEIPCYEKNVKEHPNAITERDDGIEHINTYRIAVDRKCNPSAIEVNFQIETDGTLFLSAELLDNSGNVIEDFNAQIMSDSELE